MRLTKLKIENFKKIVTVEIPLADVNILVGANGSGKSSIIQAVHLACCVMRQAERIDGGTTSTIGIEDLDYLPTDNYKTLGSGANWGNKKGTPGSTVTLSFENTGGALFEARCQMRSARNAGISATGSVPTDLSSLLRTKKKFFSAYIPGISGIPNKEERKSKKVILKACSFGDSNVILRNALLQLNELHSGLVSQIEGWIAGIIGPISITVQHSHDSDLFIKCEVTIGGVVKPLELAGTGYLQLIQIFCYFLLFKPGVLLIDEPDIHLHPTAQERLVRVLAEIAKDHGTRILLTTHSPFIVRGAVIGTNVCWLDDGKMCSDNRGLVELALGWGAFGKDLIIVSEDADTSMLRKLVAQWPSIDRRVAFFPGTGCRNLLTPDQAYQLHQTLGGKFKILVHRDRDSLTDEEIGWLSSEYSKNNGVDLWAPDESDIEAYFCRSDFLERFLACSKAVADGYLTTIFSKFHQTIQDQFNGQRKAHNQELHEGGGSPTNADVWTRFQSRPLRGAKGKFVLNQLKNTVPGGAFSLQKLAAFALDGSVAEDLKRKIEEVLR